MSSLGFVNTQTFREAAIYWEKNKRYDDGVPGTLYNDAYWNREIDRCINGYSSGGVKITGYHYHYLNYCRIEVVEETYGEVHKNKPKNAKTHGDRLELFPDFWDVDFAFFKSCDIAEYGITLEEYNSLPMDLHIHQSGENLGGGHHIVYLKPRGVGASWKAASMAERNYACIRVSKTYMLANDGTFLTDDGLWSKYLSMRDWQIANALGLGKSSDFKKERAKMHMEASRDVNGQRVGFKSEVIGLSLNNDWQKARGKRGKLVLYEELGKFPNADKAWRINRRSVEQGNVVYGLMLGFGTGGTKDANFEALKTMFYDPAASNILLFDNYYGENKQDNKVVGMFTPATMNIAFKDNNGNSDQIAAKDYMDSEREIAKKAREQSTYAAVCAEDPYTPEEAVLVTGKNIFISEGLINHAKRLELSGDYKNYGTTGYFSRIGTELKFKVDQELRQQAVYKFPNSANETLEGAVIMYQEPFKKNGRVPNGLYKIWVDTYEHDDTTGNSVGAIYVVEQPNNFTPSGGDIIVATFVGRPNEGQNKFNEILFQLGEYYGGDNGNPYLIAFENDKPGDVGGYATRKHKLHYLADEMKLAFNEEIKTSDSSRRNFGISMNSGKENKRKKQGDIYAKNWIYKVRYVKEDGSIVYNYHAVRDLGLLQEWINYDIDGNRDRHSAWRVGMYHQQELEYNEEVPMLPQNVSSVDNFFAKDLF